MSRLSLLGLLLWSCSRPEPVSPFRVRIAASAPLDPLSPSLSSGFSNLINPLVYQSLVTPTRNGQWRSSLVSGFTRQNGTNYRFRISEDAAFGDGTTVGRDDLLRALEGKATIGTRDSELELTLTSPHRAADLHEAVVSKSTPFGVFGTGPFSIIGQSDQSILLRRRTAAPGRVQEVELVSFPTPRDAFAAVLRGEVNMLVMASDGELELLSGVQSLKVLRGTGLLSLAIVFNAQRLSVAERRALARSVPTAELTAAFGSTCSRRGERSHEKPDTGRTLDIGAFDGFQAFHPTALALRRELGARAGKLVFLHSASDLQLASRKEFDLTVTLVQNWPTETALTRWVTDDPSNWGGYSNPRFDEAIQSGDLVRAQAELDADPPLVVICDLERNAIVDARIKNAWLGDYDPLDTLPDWEVAP